MAPRSFVFPVGIGRSWESVQMQICWIKYTFAWAHESTQGSGLQTTTLHRMNVCSTLVCGIRDVSLVKLRRTHFRYLFQMNSSGNNESWNVGWHVQCAYLHDKRVQGAHDECKRDRRRDVEEKKWCTHVYTHSHEHPDGCNGKLRMVRDIMRNAKKKKKKNCENTRIKSAYSIE